jgi:hypothetical protein
MTETSLNRRNADASDINRIRKLLARASLPTTDVFERAAANHRAPRDADATH